MSAQVLLRHEGLRAPAFSRVTHAELHATCLEQSAWADANGFDFDMAGIEPAHRGRLLEEAVEVMRQAWTGEPFCVAHRGWFL